MLRQFFKDSTFNFIQQGWALVIGLLTSIVVARGLGAEDRGIYALVMLLSGLIILFLNSGIEPAIIYHIARGEYALADLIASSLILNAGVSLIGCLAAWGVITLFHAALFPAAPPQRLLLSLLVIPTSIFASNTQAIFRGLQDFRTYSLIEIITQPIALLLSLLLIVWLGWGVPGAIIAIAVRYVVVVGLVRYFLRDKSVHLIAVWRPSIIADIFVYSLKAYAYNVSIFLNQRADVFLLNLLRTNPALIGVYDVAVALAERFWAFSRAVSIVIFSRIASMQNVESERNKLTTIVVRYAAWSTLILAALIYILADWFISLVYGSDFLGSALALKLLLPGTLTLGMGLILSNDIAGRGKPHWIVLQSLFGLAINIGVNVILIPQWSFAGAAIASSISYSVITILTVTAFSRMTGIPARDLILPSRADLILWRRGWQWLRSRLRPAA
jgi:O-antigen/teichoic acid export membrane protein